MRTMNVDSRGTACPGPITDLIRAYKKAENGDIIVLIANDPGSVPRNATSRFPGWNSCSVFLSNSIMDTSPLLISFAYIFLNTKLAGSKTGVYSPATVISRYNSLLEQYAFSIIFGLILVTIGMEILSVNSKYLIKIPAGLMAQKSEAMIIAGFVVMILGLAISTYRHIRTGEIKKPTIVPATR